MPPDPRIPPRRRIAEAFATVFAPSPRPICRVPHRQLPFPPLRRPSQFPPYSPAHLPRHHPFICAPPAIAQPQPHEVKQLMHENPGEILRIRHERFFKHHPPLTQKRSRVRDGPGSVQNRCLEFDAHRPPRHRRDGCRPRAPPTAVVGKEHSSAPSPPRSLPGPQPPRCRSASRSPTPSPPRWRSACNRAPATAPDSSSPSATRP
jgi:hypothetical protein